MKNPETIKIKIANYSEEYPELFAEVKRLGLQRFDSLDFQFKQIPTGEYHVETAHIFGNQYNTVEGFRVFEVCTALHRGGRGNFDKRGGGYYISEGIEEIRAYQDRVKACGYCEKQYLDTEKTICRACLGSQYLKADELHLLRLMPIRESFGSKRELAPDELLALTEEWKTAQGLGAIVRERAAKSHNRQKVAALIPTAEKKAADLVACAEIETRGLTWLLDHEINILDNVIYYNHTGVFSFGWIKPLTDEQKVTLEKQLDGFPYEWEFHRGNK